MQELIWKWRLINVRHFFLCFNVLTHWGRVTHMCVAKLTIIVSDNGLSPGRRQAIIWTNAGILLIGTLGTNFSEIFIELPQFSFKKMYLKMASDQCPSCCLCFNVLMGVCEQDVYIRSSFKIYIHCGLRLLIMWSALLVYNVPYKYLCCALRWRHNGCDSVSNHQLHDCLLNRLFRRRSKKTSKLRVTGLCVGNSPGTGEFPAQMTSDAENVSIWWRHHGTSRLRLDSSWCLGAYFTNMD